MSKITEIVQYLSEAKVMFFATVDGEKPHVRPIGFVMEYDGKAYFTTSEAGPIYAELQSNPFFEISTMHPEKPFHRIRFYGKANFDATTEVFDKYYELNPELIGMPNISLFSADNWEAVIYEGFEDKEIITQ